MIAPLLTVDSLAVAPTLSFAEDDAAAGAGLFRKRKACHALGQGGRNEICPEFTSIIGQKTAALRDFVNSDVLVEMGAEGKILTPEEFDVFLTKPRDDAKGTKMSHAGLQKEDDYQNAIAILATLPLGRS